MRLNAPCHPVDQDDLDLAGAAPRWTILALGMPQCFCVPAPLICWRLQPAERFDSGQPFPADASLRARARKISTWFVYFRSHRPLPASSQMAPPHAALRLRPRKSFL